jgi:phage FluMu protein Com
MSDIRCEKCDKKIAEGEKPANVKIKCKKCGHINDLSKPDDRPYSERIPMERKKKDPPSPNQANRSLKYGGG